MRRAKIFYNNIFAGFFEEIEKDRAYRFAYETDYAGPSISLTLPRSQPIHEFQNFPPFFEGLLPEGFQLEALLRENKIDRNDLFSQLMLIGSDTVGAVTAEEMA